MIADIVALDANGRTVLLVEVEGMTVSEDLLPKFRSYLETEGEPVPFGMVADPKSIYVFRYDRVGHDGDTCEFDTAGVLRHYDPEFGEKKRISHGYLGVLIGAWLNDLAYHWKTETPPGSAELAAISLLPRLEGGATRREVPFGVDALR